METTFDGYCGTCRGKCASGPAAAKTCGHQTANADACFCTVCALRLRVCQACGVPIPLPPSVAERDD